MTYTNIETAGIFILGILFGLIVRWAYDIVNYSQSIVNKKLEEKAK